jgi:hypothetical protein
MRPHTHYEPSNGPQMAIWHSHGQTRCHVPDMLRWHHSYVVCVKRSNSNVKPKTKLNALLVTPLDQGKWPYLPCTAPTYRNYDKHPERDCEGLGGHYTPSKKCERHIHRSPAWLEWADFKTVRQTEMRDSRHMLHVQTHLTLVSRVVLINYLHYIHSCTCSMTCTNHSDDHEVAILLTPQSDLMQVMHYRNKCA